MEPVPEKFPGEERALQILEADEYRPLMDLVEEALEQDPGNLTALRLKAIAAYGLGEHRLFLETIDHAIDLEPSDPGMLLSIKSVGLLGMERVAEAQVAAEEAVARSPHFANGHDALAQAYLRTGRPEDALAASEEAVRLGPDDLALVATMSQAAIAAGANEKAIVAADRLLDADGENTDALTLKAVALGRLGKTEEAVAAAERARELNPDSSSVLRVYAAVMALSEDADRAELAFREWTQAEPGSAAAWGGLGAVYIHRQEPEQALMALRKAVEHDQGDADYRLWLGDVLLELEDNNEALGVFSDLTDSDANNELAWLGRTKAERALGFPEWAVKSARMALCSGSFRSAEGWLELGRSYSAGDRHRNARYAFAEAAKVDPTSRDAALGIGVESIFCDRVERGLNELQAADGRFGPWGMLDFNLGVAYHRLGNRRAADHHWERAHKLEPELEVPDFYDGPSPGAGWVEYWFGSGSSWKACSGLAMSFLLLFFLVVPILEPGVLPGIESGEASISGFIPALLVGLLVVLPTIRRISVGGVSLDVAPLVEAPTAPRFDPANILPTFTSNERTIDRLASL